MTKRNSPSLDLNFLNIIKTHLVLRNKGTRRNKNTFGAATVSIDNLNEVDIELEWIQGLKEQVEFLNANMRHFSIQFKITRSNWCTRTEESTI